MRESERRAERQLDDEPAKARPQSAPTPAARLIALQRGAGNAAVSAAVARGTLGRAPGPPSPPVAAPPDPRAVAVHASDPAAADKLTLAEFDNFTQRQADWASQATFLADPTATAELRDVVLLAQEGDGDFLSAAGELKMSDLRAAVKADRGKLRGYAKAIKEYGWTPPTTVAAAVTWGEAADKLTAALGAHVVKETVKQGTVGKNVEDLIRAGAVDDYCDFVTKTNPLLTATDGSEVRSFLALRAEGGWSKYVGTVGPVRNIHHFTKAALDALVKNVADTSRAKPLAVVLHSTVDHNGAFHRDPNVAQVTGAPQSNTILIEGSGTLDAAGKSLEDAVKTYGQGTPPKARQIMLAGHGNSRVTELAGERGPDGQIKADDVDLDKNSAESLELIKTMLANLDSDPKARIVLNGCLTASASAVPALPRGASAADRKQAHDDLAKELQAKRSLADTIRDMAAAQGIKPGQVSAANSSFGSEVSLIDPATGDLGLRSPDDPLMTSADKFAYVAAAGEATGAGRALVECILADEAKAKTAAQKRLTVSLARTTWDDTVIKALYREALVDLGDIAFINLAADLSGGLSEIQFPDMARPWMIWKAKGDVLTRMLTRLEKNPEFANQTPPLMKLVAYQVWMKHDATKEALFLQALSKFTVQEAAEMVRVDFVQSNLASLLPAAPGAHAAGELRLALLDVASNGATADAASIAYLRKRRTGAQFTNAQEITKALGGKSSAASILEDIKEPSGAAAPVGAAAPPDPDYNVDLDGDGKNDFYVEPMVRRGVTAVKVDVHQKPDASSPVLGKLPESTGVDVIGESGGWTCFEFGASKKPGFAKGILVF